MTQTTDRIEQGRLRAVNFARAKGLSEIAAEEFASEYAAVLEDRAHEQRYPDVPLPTPEEVWFS